MRSLAPRPAVRALLALTLLLGSLGVWTAALPASADGQAGQAERVGAQVLSGAEQVVQADRPPLSRSPVDRRGDLGRFRSVLLGVLVAIALVGGARRRWDRGGRGTRSPWRGAAPPRASRAPPGLRTA